LRHRAGGAGRVVKGDRLDAAGLEKFSALEQSLRVGESAHHRLAAAQQAVADRVDDLAADPHAAALPEEVVDLLHDAAKRVLDREDCRVDLARGERVEGAREGWKADRRGLRQHGDGGLFGVSAGLALVADACPARMRIHGREILSLPSLPTAWGGRWGRRIS